MKQRFHYTKALHLASICADGVIKPATKYVAASERAVVWCSSRLDYEPSARPGIGSIYHSRPCTLEEMMADPTISPVRIEVDPATCPYDWGAFIKLSGVKRKLARSLAELALAEGSRTEDWYVSFEPIGALHWKTIAYYSERSWSEISASAQVIEQLAKLSVQELRTAVAAGLFSLRK